MAQILSRLAQAKEGPSECVCFALGSHHAPFGALKFTLNPFERGLSEKNPFFCNRLSTSPGVGASSPSSFTKNPKP